MRGNAERSCISVTLPAEQMAESEYDRTQTAESQMDAMGANLEGHTGSAR
jgi:hypothetical protein